MPQVSVVIATHNMGQYVAEAISSVLAQPGQDLEVIVVDDGSTDGTSGILGAFSGNPRVRVISQDNQGQPKAKNVGWRAARGTFVAFCDADDYWLPNKLALQLPLFERNLRIGVVYSKAAAIDADGRMHPPPQRIQPKGQVLEQLFVRNRVPFGTAVVRRECLEQVGGFDENIPMGIDWDLWLRIALSWEFDCVPDATYVYRRWSGQMSHNWLGRYQSALQIMDQFVASHPGILPQRIINTAYADTYTSLAGAYLEHDRSGPAASLLCIGKAVRHRPTFWPAWWLLLSFPLRRLRAARRRTTKGVA